MPKLLRCPICNDTAVGRPNSVFPAGEPMFIGSLPVKGLTAKCGRCKRAFTIRSEDYRKLKDVGVKELIELGFPKELFNTSETANGPTPEANQ